MAEQINEGFWQEIDGASSPGMRPGWDHEAEVLALAGRWAGVIIEVRGLGLGLPHSGLWPEHLA